MVGDVHNRWRIRSMISVVVPVFGCKDCIYQLVDRIVNALSPNRDIEIILVDDSSVDGSWEMVRAISKKYDFVLGFRLAKNSGQHVAILAGLKQSKGDQVIVMDCDLQDPPEMIPSLIAGLRESPISIALRRGHHQTRFRSLQNRVFQIIYRFLTGDHYDNTATSFSALNRNVVDEYVKFTEVGQHYLFVLRWLGFKQTYIEYERPLRSIGTSSYSFFDRIKHGSDAILFGSTRLLRFAAVVGALIAGFGFALLAFVLIGSLGSRSPSGWTSTISVVLVFSGLMLLLQSLLGAYVTRIFQETKGRPLYVIAERT